LVAYHGEQPTAERAALRVVFESANAARNRLQDILREIGGVRVLQAMLAREAVDQGRIQLYELRPGAVIAAVAQTDQEAEPRGRRIAHAATPPPTSTDERRHLIAPRSIFLPLVPARNAGARNVGRIYVLARMCIIQPSLTM